MLHSALSADVIARLPSPQGVALALTQACRRDDANLDEICGLVRTDPALSGRLLALANTAALGGRSVVSVEEAVSRMGLLRVSQLALAFSLIDQHGSGHCRAFDYTAFWNRSLLMAAASREFGSLRKLGVSGELFTVGLLAQVGCLALATAFPEDYADLITQKLVRSELLQRQQSRLLTTEVQLSVDLMEHWGIPAEYARPFGLNETTELFPGHSTSAQRARLAHSAWVLAGILADQGIEAALDTPQCLAALQWLELERADLQAHFQEIDAVWRVWLELIAHKV